MPQNFAKSPVPCIASQIYSGDFAKFRGLLRIYELYKFVELFCSIPVSLVKFIYSEKASKFCEISTLLLTGTT